MFRFSPEPFKDVVPTPLLSFLPEIESGVNKKSGGFGTFRNVKKSYLARTGKSQKNPKSLEKCQKILKIPKITFGEVIYPLRYRTLKTHSGHPPFWARFEI